MSTADLHLRACLVLDEAGRIVSTREPEATRGPLFAIVRSATACAWAVHRDLSADVAGEIDRLARDEPPATDLRDAPAFAERYVALLNDRVAASRLPAEAYRGSGYGARVTAAWALTIRASGQVPLYSTSWTNHGSLAVARKLRLSAYACSWGVSD